MIDPKEELEEGVIDIYIMMLKYYHFGQNLTQQVMYKKPAQR